MIREKMRIILWPVLGLSALFKVAHARLITTSSIVLNPFILPEGTPQPGRFIYGTLRKSNPNPNPLFDEA